MSEQVSFVTSSIKTGLHVLVSLVLAMAAGAMAFLMAPSQAPWETLLAVILAGAAACLWSHFGGLWASLAGYPLLLWPLAWRYLWRFVLSYVPNFLLQNFFVLLIYNILAQPKLLAYSAAACFSVPITFLALKLFAFRRSNTP